MQGEMLARAFSRYLEDCEKLRSLSSKTIKGYREGLNRFFCFLGDGEFNLACVQKYHLYLKNKNTDSSIHAELRIIRAFVTYLYKQELINKNWGTNIGLPKLKKKHETLPRQDKALEAIFAGTVPGLGDNSRNKKIKLDVRDALTFIVLTGLRQVEISRLKPSNFDLENLKYVVNSKGGNEDTMPLPRCLVDMVKKRMVENATKMFDVTQSNMNDDLKRGCKKVGIPPLTVHKLRKIFGTTLVRNKTNFTLIARLMRHTNFQVTYDNYIREDISDLDLALNTGNDIGRELMTPEEINSAISDFIKTLNLDKNSNVREYAINETINKQFEVKVIYNS